MANYWITNNAKFRPFSYDEMIRPVEKMYTEHKGVEEGLAELQTKAGIWEGLANEQTDPVTYAQYKRYADELKMAADDLAMNGLNARSRQGLYNMKARYASEITPIEVAYNRREKLAEEQRKLNAQSGFNTRFDVDFSTASLDKLLANPQISYTGINGDEVVKRTSQMASSIAKAISRMPEFVDTKNGEINKQYFMQRMQQGATLEEVLAEITGREDAPKELSLIRNTIKSQLADNPAYDEKWVNALINQGMYSAIGSAQYDLVTNRNFASDLDLRKDARDQARFAWEEADRDAVLSVTLPDGTQGYKDRFGFYTKNADGSKNYRYDLTTSSGKPVSSNIPNVANMVKETTGKGTPTGRYYDPKTRKYYNADGSICANQKNMTGKEESAIDAGTSMLGDDIWTLKNPDGTEFTADFVNGNKMTPARNDRQSLFHDNFFSPGDAKKIKWDDISESAENNIRTYVAKNGFPGIIGKKMSDYFDLYEDYDLLSHSRYRIVPKTDDPIGTEYNERTTTRTSVPTSSPAPQDSVAAPQDSIPLIPDSIPLTNDMFGNKGI